MTNLFKFLLISTCFGLSTTDVADAQLRLPFGKNHRTAQKPAPDATDLTEKGGPWLIMCASFSGDEGAEQAYRLSQELKAELGLPTYVYRHFFDINKTVAGKARGWELADNAVQGNGVLIPKRMKLASEGQFEEIAVLVGDFPTIDDGRAQQVLAKVKSAKPRSLASNDSVDQLDEQATSGDRVRAFRDMLAKKESSTEVSSDGPLRQAFLLPNPLLPDEYFNNRQVDSFVAKMNKGLKYSLLKNEGMYTIKVASFGGDKTLNTDAIAQKMKKMEWLKKSGQGLETNKLVTAAKRASILARHLRKRGIEAYEFHDRKQSYVCVGSFDWVTRKTASGAIETNPDPEVRKTLQMFTGELLSTGRDGHVAKSFELPAKFAEAGVACSPNPEAMLVPKSSVASTASRFMGKFR